MSDGILHRLWSKAVGTADYDKAEWKQLEALIWDRTNKSEVSREPSFKISVWKDGYCEEGIDLGHFLEYESGDRVMVVAINPETGLFSTTDRVFGVNDFPACADRDQPPDRVIAIYESFTRQPWWTREEGT